MQHFALFCSRLILVQYVMPVIAADAPTVKGSVIIRVSRAASGLTPTTGTFNED